MASIIKITAKDAAGMSIGHASVDIIGSDLPTSGVAVMIFRPDLKEFLGPAGWQADQSWFSPEVMSADGGTLSIAIEPRTTAYLELGTNYMLHLRGDGIESGLTRSLAWRGVSPLSRSQINNILGPKQAAPTADAPATEEAPVPPVPPPPVATVAPPVEQDLPVTSAAKPNRKPLMLILGALLLLAVAGGAFWALQGDRAASSAPQAAATTPEERLRQFMRTSPTPEQMIAEAEQLRQRGAVAEAEFLLRAALDAGNSEGARLLGILFDPTSLTPDRQTQSPTADLAKAYSYYRKAIEAGNTAAASDLARLRVHVEREAEIGGEEARNLLRVWRN